MEYLAAEVLELAGIAVRNTKKNRIILTHFQFAIGNDEELNKLLFGRGEILSNCQVVVFPKKTEMKL